MTEVLLDDMGGVKLRVGVDVGGIIAPAILKAPKQTKEIFDKLPDFKYRKEDIMLCSYQKTGTNWLFEILSMINNRSAERVKMNKIMTMLEITPQSTLTELPSPRILNCHFRLSYLPKDLKDSKIKTVLCVRNPKDTAVSFYNHTKGLKQYGYDGKFADWLPLYLQGKLEYGKYTDYLMEWDRAINNGVQFPLHIIYFEDLLLNGEKELDKLLRFLGVDLEEQLKKDILDQCGFEKMAKEKLFVPDDMLDKVFNKGFRFYRKGEIGDWKNWFTVAQNEMFEQIWNTEMKDSSKFHFTFTDARIK